MSDSIIRVEQLGKRFGRVAAISDLSFDVPPGAVFALAGPSGAGKTTAIKTLLNIHRPSTGKATVLGVDSRRIGPAELQQIGYVSEGQDLPDWMRVDQFFEYCRNFYPTWDDTNLAALVEMYQLPLNRPLKSLSRGMRMKAALASALAYQPRLLLLDEPFTALDVLVRDQLIESILERLPELTVVLASHDLAEIESFASHVCYINDGRVLFTEEMHDLTGRFRDVEIQVDSSAGGALTPSPEWLGFERTESMIHFVDSQFDRGSSESALRDRIPGIRAVEVRPMPLRSIFVALAKGGGR